MQHRSAEAIRVLTRACPGCQSGMLRRDGETDRQTGRQTRVDRVVATWEKEIITNPCECVDCVW